MKLPELTPERRKQLLANEQRAEFYEYLKARFGKPTAERYLQTCNRRICDWSPKHPRRVGAVKGLLLGELVLTSLTSCGIGDYGTGLPGETSSSTGSGFSYDDLAGAIGGAIKGGAGQVYQSSNQPESSGSREQHGSVDRAGCERMLARFRREGRRVRLADIQENNLAPKGMRTLNYICIFEGEDSTPGYYGTYPQQHAE